MGNYKINDINVDILFRPKVIETFATKDEIDQVNNIDAFQEIEIDKLESHFNNIFKIIKKRVFEFETYTMFFDTIEYKNVQLIWKSGYDHKLKLMEIVVSYSQMNDANYQQSMFEVANEFYEAQENGEDMMEWIKTHHEDTKRKGKKPIVAGMLPEIKKPTIN